MWVRVNGDDAGVDRAGTVWTFVHFRRAGFGDSDAEDVMRAGAVPAFALTSNLDPVFRVRPCCREPASTPVSGGRVEGAGGTIR
jgi:hypothetical protein